MATKVVVASPVKPGFPLTVGVDTDVIAPYKYVWTRNGMFLAAPSQPCYTITQVSKDDMSAKWGVIVWGQNGSDASPEIGLPLPAAPKDIPPQGAPPEEKK